MASSIGGKITKVNTLVNADLSSDDSDDECDKRKRQGLRRKRSPSSKGNRNKNENSVHSIENTIKYDERTKNENPIDRKANGKYGYFVPPLQNNFYPSHPVNQESVFRNYPSQGANIPRLAPPWNGNHFENVLLLRSNGPQLKYYPDFIINNPNISELTHSTIANLPSAHHVAKDNELSRYYSVLELPRPQKSHVTFTQEALKDDRYFYGKPPVVNFPNPFPLRNKQQTFKAPPMEAPYPNPNGQLRYENGGPPRVEIQNRPPVQPNNGNPPSALSNFPDQFNSRNPINPNPQGMKSAYSVYAPGNLNSQSLNNVYVPSTTVYPVHAQTLRGGVTGNDTVRPIHQPQLPNSPPVEKQSMGNNTVKTIDSPKVIRNFPTRWKRNETIPSRSNSPPKNPIEEKQANSPNKVLICPKSNCPSPRCGQGPYEGSNLSASNLSVSKSLNKDKPNPGCDCNGAKEIPDSLPPTDVWNVGNLSTIPVDYVRRMFEALKLSLENSQRPKQNAEVQNNLPEIVREDKTTHTQYVVEDKETQYKPTNAKEVSHDVKEIGTQVRYIEQKAYSRKCQGVTALHSHFRARSPSSDWKQGESKFKLNIPSDSKYYIDLGDIKEDTALQKKTKAYQEIVDIIKRENGKDNQEMADVIFNMIYGKNCHIVVQKGAVNGEGKKTSPQKNVKKNQGISTTNIGLKNRPGWKDVWKPPSREKIRFHHYSSPLPPLAEHEVFPKNEMHSLIYGGKDKKIDELKKLCDMLETNRPGINNDISYFLNKPPDIQTNLTVQNEKPSFNLEDHFYKKNSKVKFLDPLSSRNTADEKDEIVVDLENKKILECILNNDNRPKGEIVIDVGCVQLPDDSAKTTAEHFRVKENLKGHESGTKLSGYVSRTELYEEAILNLIAKQIKKCTSEWKFDVKDDDDDEVEESKRVSPVPQISASKKSIPNSEASVDEKIPTMTTPPQKEKNSNVSEMNSKNLVGKSDCGNGVESTLKKEQIPSEEQELNEFYESIKFLFGMLDNGEKYEFISDVMKKINNFYSKESNSTSSHSPKTNNLDGNDSKQGITIEEETALADILRMICYENDMANVEDLLPLQPSKPKANEAGECTNSTSSENPSNVDFSVRDEILSNYVLLDTPDMITNLTNRFDDKHRAQTESRTVSRGVSANL